MGILLKDIIDMPCFDRAKLVAGTVGRDVEVEGITIIEAPDIVNWIKGGEVLLTSFYSIDKDIDIQKKLVSKIAKKGSAALIIKTSRFLREIPKEIINLGNEIDFPIIEIPGELKYIDIMYPVMGEIFNDQVNRLNFFKECHEKFTELSLESKGITSIAQTLEDLVKNPVIIFNNDLEPIAFNNEKYKKLEDVKKTSDKYILKLPLEGNEIYTMVLHEIKVFNDTKGYIGIVEEKDRIREMDFIALRSAATTFRLQMLKDIAVAEVELKHKGDLFDELIQGKFDSVQNILDRGNLLGWNLKKSFTVVIINMNKYDNYIRKQKKLTEELYSLGEKIKKIIKRVLCYYVTDYISVNKGGSIIILWPINKMDDIKATYKNIKKFGNKLIKDIIKEIYDISISIGIGGVAESLEDIRKSYSEAKDAVNYGYRIFGNNAITIYDDLGVYRLLCEYDNREELKKFLHPALVKLQEYDREKNNELIDTLEMYMECNLNALKTSEKLFVHYKTVLYRLNKIKELTNLEIDDRNRMLEVEIGLKIMHIIN